MGDVKTTMHYKHYRSWSEFKESAKVIIPPCQRNLDSDRIKGLKDHIYKNQRNRLDPYFRALDICILDGKLYLVDGQHRLEAIKKCFIEHKDIDVAFSIKYYDCRSYAQLCDVFKTLNQNVAVPNYLLFESHSDSKLYKDISAWILQDYKLFKDSSVRIVRPFLSIDVFFEAIGLSSGNLGITSVEEFKVRFNNWNDYLRKKYADFKNKKDFTITDAMMTKCKKDKNYFGLDKNYSWLSEVGLNELVG